jgi:hypothetical protein
MDLVREKRIKEEEEREELNQIYKEKIAKIEQEKLVQTEAEIKLEEGESETRSEELQEQEKIIWPVKERDEEKNEEKETDKKED